ncbi:MAG: hypothetical protein AN484_06575 [Aphanizomenon flos-aquae WA102]|uniref:Uncharacterized protein n=1 Tax=Aphanizomenon flos-aquae WA102 TaxID=1710896 RepID=A0A1B7X5A1_APHFL|nr:MAG: hypothetical protein AN484_06575 [Aphanizomenon flos-aquae WA102]
MTSTITDKLNTDGVKLILRELQGRNRDSTNTIKVGVFRAESSLNLGNETEVLRTTTIIKNSLGKLGELLDSLGNLALNLEGGLQIIQADARGLISLRLEVPSADSLTEVKTGRSGIATIGGSSIGDTDIRPIRFNGTRQNTLNGDFAQGGAHSLRKFSDTDKAAPRAINGVTLMNVNGEAIRLTLEQVVNCATSNRSRHKVKIFIG